MTHVQISLRHIGLVTDNFSDLVVVAFYLISLGLVLNYNQEQL